MSVQYAFDTHPNQVVIASNFHLFGVCDYSKLFHLQNGQVRGRIGQTGLNVVRK